MPFRRKSDSEAVYIQFVDGFEELSDFKLMLARDLYKAANEKMFPKEYYLALKEVLRRREIPWDS